MPTLSIKDAQFAIKKDLHDRSDEFLHLLLWFAPVLFIMHSGSVALSYTWPHIEEITKHWTIVVMIFASFFWFRGRSEKQNFSYIPMIKFFIVGIFFSYFPYIILNSLTYLYLVIENPTTIDFSIPYGALSFFANALTAYLLLRLSFIMPALAEGRPVYADLISRTGRVDDKLIIVLVRALLLPALCVFLYTNVTGIAFMKFAHLKPGKELVDSMIIAFLYFPVTCILQPYIMVIMTSTLAFFYKICEHDVAELQVSPA